MDATTSFEPGARAKVGSGKEQTNEEVRSIPEISDVRSADRREVSHDVVIDGFMDIFLSWLLDAIDES